ncbi:MAG: glycosyltransferase family 4 protein [Candidatus Binatia bacterium]
MHKALVIAYRFPPQGGISVHRTVKFVRYLDRFGWQPIVHTVRNPFWHLRDEALIHEVPTNVPVYRTRALEFERFEQRLAFLSSKSATQQKTQQPTPLALTPEQKKSKRGRLSTLQQFIHQRVLMPDPQIAWIPWAFLKSIYIARKERVDLIYTSSPPNSSQVLGLWLKRVLKKPWVADFRDPWTDGIRRKQSYIGNPFRQRFEEGWERAVAERADHLIVNTEKNQEQFLAKYPFLSSRITTLTNGFDATDFTHISREKKFLPQGCFHLTLTGNVETMFDATPFFRAVSQFLDEEPEARARFRINFVGTKRGKYDQIIQELQLTTVVNYIGYVPHADSIQHLADSDVLFLCQIPEYESAVVKLPGKLFEYLYMRKPVLALTLPGVTTAILERAGLGVVVHPNDTQGITTALHDLYQQWRQTHWRFTPNHDFIDTFDRVRLTERLAQIFDRVTGGADAAVNLRKGVHSVSAPDTATAL